MTKERVKKFQTKTYEKDGNRVEEQIEVYYEKYYGNGQEETNIMKSGRGESNRMGGEERAKSFRKYEEFRDLVKSQKRGHAKYPAFK